MQTLKKDLDNKYNEEPVHYCAKCLSLSIKNLEGEGDYCTKCSSTHINITNIFDWQSLFYNKYNYNFLDGKKRNKFTSK